jgi:integrase
VSAFYRWCVRERLIDRNPIDAIRRPARPTALTTVSLTRHELTDWLAASERRGGAWWAAAMLLGLNGLRCGELIACDVTDVGSHSWHDTPRDQGHGARRSRSSVSATRRPCLTDDARRLKSPDVVSALQRRVQRLRRPGPRTIHGFMASKVVADAAVGSPEQEGADLIGLIG